MLQIDLDHVWEIVKPKSVALKMDGRVYPVRRLLLADVRRLAEFSSHSRGDNVTWLRTLFEGGEPPPCVASHANEMDPDARRENDFKVVMILEAISRTWLDESDDKKKAAIATRAIERQLAPHRSTE